jgi:hypothetical protein
MPTVLEAEHPVVSITMLPTGRIFLATEKRLYELDGTNTWIPMKFEVAEPPAAATSTAKPGLFAPATKTTAETSP